jgi:hypothetical protein
LASAVSIASGAEAVLEQPAAMNMVAAQAAIRFLKLLDMGQYLGWSDKIRAVRLNGR